tara:strand:+ start:223964 stop:224563 length:600 start_codon:yes stop_codon:yes gene_type:complete
MGLKNLLPYDGEVFYWGPIFEPSQSYQFFEDLLNKIAWKNDEARMFGRTMVTKRKVAWYAEKPFTYTYSKVTKQALPWIPILEKLNSKVKSVCGDHFNSCLLNLYHSGVEGMAWHSDGEKDLVKHGVIASVSFGAERKFSFKHKKSKESVSLTLEAGSLLIMKGETQDHWLHRLPPTKKVSEPRINLTFRQIQDSTNKD